MTPLEAWHIISKNMTELYNRRLLSGLNMYEKDEIKAESICYIALKEMEERINKDERTKI